MLETFENQELNSIVRLKLNNAIEEINDISNKSIDFSPLQPLLSGNITSKTPLTMTDLTKTWSNNIFVDKVVKLTSPSGEDDYAVISANTSNTLSFDYQTLNYDYSSYIILDTAVVTDESTIVSLDLRNNNGAVILPLVSSFGNRDYLRVYVEQANGGNYSAVVICRQADKQAGYKYGVLSRKREGLLLYTHQSPTPHWDILQMENIKRFATFDFSSNVPITTTTLTSNVPFTSVYATNLNKFSTRNNGGIFTLKYKSLVDNTFLLNGGITLEKTGGGNSIVNISFLHFDSETGITSQLNEVRTIRMTADQITTIPLSINVNLRHNDELVIATSRNSGTINILSGSSIVVSEL